MTRQPSRAAITASATMIGLAIVVGVGGMLFSLVGTAEAMFNRSMGSDYLLLPPSVAVWKGDVGASQTLKGKLSSIPGVSAVNSLRYAQSSIPSVSLKTGTGDATISVLGLDPVDYAKMSGMDFISGNAQDAFSALAAGERNVIVNGVLATPLGLKVGDMVPLATPTGQQDYRIVAIGSDVLSMKINTAYISQANMKLDFNKSEDILYQINLAKGADAASPSSGSIRLSPTTPSSGWLQEAILGGVRPTVSIDHLGVLCSARRAGLPIADRHPQYAGDRRHRAHARDRHVARNRRDARSDPQDRGRGGAAAGGARHGLRHPGRSVS